MQPLLKIQTVPISIEYKVTRAALQYRSTPAAVNVTRTHGSLGIQTTQPKLQVDSFETNASAGNKSPRRTIEEFADAGKQAAYDATRALAEDGNAIAEGSTTADIAASKAFPPPAQTMMTFIPSVRPEISIQPGSISFDVSLDKLTFDWNIQNRPQLEYVPGSIEFNVTQYNEVIIEYMGSPIYVPPSADPNYQPPPNIDVNA